MAAFISSDGDDETIATINIIPFVDIALVLLIIFMVTSSVIAKASLRVDLPRAASAGEGVDSTLNIVLTRDDVIFLNGQQATREQVAAFVRQEVSREPGLRAVIAADTISEYGRVIALIDLVKKNGVKTFALNIERELDQSMEQAARSSRGPS
jgi:biopolymer transport protein ExbD